MILESSIPSVEQYAHPSTHKIWDWSSLKCDREILCTVTVQIADGHAYRCLLPPAQCAKNAVVAAE